MCLFAGGLSIDLSGDLELEFELESRSREVCILPTTGARLLIAVPSET